MRKSIIVIFGLLIAYVAIELVSFTLLACANFFRPAVFTASIDEILKGLQDNDLQEYLHSNYDPTLGWDNKPGTSRTDKNCRGEPWSESFGPDGARNSPLEYPTTLIASYGDSYVKGGEVNDDQTWQYQLSKQLRQGVKNYAVGAYGTYQALLKAKSHLAAGRVYPVTLLGINEQNIKRVVNLYRPFMYRAVSDKFSFKPGLWCNSDQCEAIANPLTPDTHTVKQIRGIAAQARRWDYWARQHPSFEFPWSINMLKLVRLGLEHMTEKDSEPLWHTPEGIAAMRLIISEFRDAVQIAGSLPVVLFIPQTTGLGSRPSYVDFKESIAAQYPDLVIVDVSDAEFDHKKFRLKQANCHPSVYGHSIIAKSVYEGLAGRLPNPTARP